ncbi:MAG: heme ABC transporter ATP-binding protein [Betaproteobacteria bacterium]|nr:heme ABC transporter ATP-binding protein [Betaproteobacteria bacterium]
MIVAQDLVVEIGGKTIINRICLQLARGTVTAIVGPNGSGKSVLMRCLAGSQPVASGRVELDGKPLAAYSLAQLACKRAVLTQFFPVGFPFTALEIVMMGRNPYANSCCVAHNEHIALQALAAVDAVHLQQRIFPTLSGGEQQRVQLARVLAQLWEQNGACLFLDEPTSALDIKHQHQFLEDVRQLAANRNFAVCMIVHDLMLVMRYADRVALLKNGSLVAWGKTAAVIDPDAIEYVFEVPAGLVLPAKRF